MSKVVYSNSNVQCELITWELVESIKNLNVENDHFIIVKSDTAKFMAEFDGITFNLTRQVFKDEDYRFKINPVNQLLHMNGGVAVTFNGIKEEYGQLFITMFMEHLSHILINDDNNTVLIIACNNKLEADKVFESKSYKVENKLMTCMIDFMKEQKRTYYVIYSNNGKPTEYQLNQFLDKKGLPYVDTVSTIGEGAYLLNSGFELLDVLGEIQTAFNNKNTKNATDSGFTLVEKDYNVEVYIVNFALYSKYEVNDNIIKLH